MTIQLGTGEICFEGNSLTAGYPNFTSPYPTQLMTQLGNPAGLNWNNLAVPGSTTIDMTSRAGAADATFSAGPTNILVAWEIINDIGKRGLTGAQAYQAFATYCQARQQRGWYVVALTMISNGGSHPPASFTSSVETERQGANALLRQNASKYCNLLVDVGADGTSLGAAGAYANATYFLPDQVHLTDVGYGVVATAVHNAIHPAVYNQVRIIPSPTSNADEVLVVFQDQDTLLFRNVLLNNPTLASEIRATPNDATVQQAIYQAAQGQLT